MQACTTVWGQTWATADGRCFSPSHTSMHTSFTPRFFIWRQHLHPVLGPLAVVVLSGPQPEHLPLTIAGDRQGHVDRPVGDLALRGRVSWS